MWSRAVERFLDVKGDPNITGLRKEEENLLRMEPIVWLPLDIKVSVVVLSCVKTGYKEALASFFFERFWKRVRTSIRILAHAGYFAIVGGGSSS